MAKESPKGLEDRDRRRFHRWDVSIPCSVEWEDTIIRGQIANLSFGGASITQVNAVPSEGARVLLTFHTRVGGVRLKNKRVARVIYVILEAMEELIIGSIGSFRVEFEELLGGSVNKCVNGHQAASSWVSLLTETPST